MTLLNFIKSKSIWLVCILSFLTAFFYNEINLNHLPQEKIRDQQTVKTNDDHSYLYPPQHYKETGIWSEGGDRDQSHYFRPPGYGIIYFTLLKTVGEENALFFLKLLQLLLFSISVYWFFYITNSLIKNKNFALIAAGVYGFTPFVIGFLYYTLTEAVTPSLLLFYVYLLIKAFEQSSQKRKNIFYISAAFLFAFIFIIRPALGVFSLLLPIFLIKDYWKTSIKITLTKLFIFGSIVFSFMVIWQIRNYNISNHFVGLNPIYDTEQISLYRPPFKEYWKFTGGWGQKGYVTLSGMDPFFIAALKGDTSIAHIDNIIESYPKKVSAFYGQKRLTTIFRKYQTVILNQRYAHENKMKLPKALPPLEQELVNDIQRLTLEFKNEFWLQYHVISPLKVFKNMAFHSNLSLYIFQHTYRGNWLMETVRFIFFGLHSLCFIGLIVGLFLFKKSDWRHNALVITAFIYVSYLCYFQRGIEERYTLPILPVLLIALFALLNQLKLKLRRQS